jgi:hypothetical protein
MPRQDTVDVGWHEVDRQPLHPKTKTVYGCGDLSEVARVAVVVARTQIHRGDLGEVNWEAGLCGNKMSACGIVALNRKSYSNLCRPYIYTLHEPTFIHAHIKNDGSQRQDTHDGVRPVAATKARCLSSALVPAA